MKEEPIKILLVEDSPGDARLLGEALAEAGSLHSELAHVERLSEAVKAHIEGSFDLILLDLGLPDAQGLDTLLQMHGQAPGVPIVVLTGLDDETLAIEALQRGAQDYLVKGQVDGNLMGRALRYAIERHRLQAELEEARQLAELESALAHQQSLTGWEQGSVTAELAGVGPIRERAPEIFEALQADYETLLDGYLESLGRGQPPPREKIDALADQIGDQQGGPRDVVDVHMRAVSAKSADARPNRVKAYVTEGRLLALEVMGHLVDYYRTGKAVLQRREERSVSHEISLEAIPDREYPQLSAGGAKPQENL